MLLKCSCRNFRRGESIVRMVSWATALGIAVLAAGFAALGAEAESAKASPCKGLEQKACAAKADCSWVPATTRKDGRKVKAYCRLKAKSSTSAKNAPKT
jgi:hypothetical protein